jgi:hypothetical protein
MKIRKYTVTKYVCRLTHDGFSTWIDLKYRGKDAKKEATSQAKRCIDKIGIQAKVIDQSRYA